jgi:hypothetical protein
MTELNNMNLKTVPHKLSTYPSVWKCHIVTEEPLRRLNKVTLTHLTHVEILVHITARWSVAFSTPTIG